LPRFDSGRKENALRPQVPSFFGLRRTDKKPIGRGVVAENQNFS
jgi:hypothetical protein